MSQYHRRHLDECGDKHHRKPRSRGGKNTEQNLISVTPKYHQAYHLLFGNLNADEIARLLNDVWIDPDVYLVCVPRKKRQPKDKRRRAFCKKCNAVVLKHLPITQPPRSNNHGRKRSGKARS